MSDSSELPVTPATFFAEPGRDSSDEFARKVALISNSELLTSTLDALPGMVMILNERRQIVAVNRAMVRVLQITGDAILAKRPGEVIGCVRPPEGPDGCGTSRYCVTCGAVNAILDSQRTSGQVIRECRVLTNGTSGATALELRVAATPLEVDGERFTLLAVDDVSQSHRVELLQRAFFHDVLNTAGCIAGYADYLAREHAAIDEVSTLLTSLSDQLIEEIHAQRDLVLAESGDLTVQTDMLTTRQILEELSSQYGRSPVAAGRQIGLSAVCSSVIWTDRRLLMRVLGNMLKNALEATPVGGSVSLGAELRGDWVAFSVSNPTVMAEPVQMQLFQRSFSTKAATGRGVGTYSMKLLGERYLGGRVDFTSQEPAGTTFTLTLPKQKH